VAAGRGLEDEALGDRCHARLTVEQPVDGKCLGERPADAADGEVVVADRGIGEQRPRRETGDELREVERDPRRVEAVGVADPRHVAVARPALHGAAVVVGKRREATARDDRHDPLVERGGEQGIVATE